MRISNELAYGSISARLDCGSFSGRLALDGTLLVSPVVVGNRTRTKRSICSHEYSWKTSRGDNSNSCGCPVVAEAVPVATVAASAVIKSSPIADAVVVAITTTPLAAFQYYPVLRGRRHYFH